MTPFRLAAPPAFISSDDDVESLRTWALEALAAGQGRRAVDVVCDVPADDEALFGALIDVETELRVRAGIAEHDRDLVLPAIALGDAEHSPHPRADLARAVGADWLVHLSEAEFGRSARFHQARSMYAIARAAVRRAVARACVLTPEQEAEAKAVAARMTVDAWRTIDAGQARRVAARRTPRKVRDVGTLLRDLRTGEPALDELVVGTVAAMTALASACEPAWPTLGGPWWTSATFGLIVDVGEPTNGAGRHRFALADCFLELEELPAVLAFSREVGAGPHQLALEALGIAECGLAHAIRAGLVG